MSDPSGIKLFLAVLVVLAMTLVQQSCFAQALRTAVVTGVITDASDRRPLPFASAVVMTPGDTTALAATVTDDAGRYEIADLRAGRYVLTVRYVGFEEQRFEFSVADGTTRTLNFALVPEPIMMDQVVVSAGANPEKILDAPVAVSVKSADDIQRDVTPSPVDVLRDVPGLDMARTGIDRREIVLRGFGKTFTGATYVMVDYRQSAIASLGVNAYNMMPISSIDLDRVEVVRGPAGALYGPGVDEGAIHFISKDPFNYPGTTLSLSGGQQSIMHGELRHAGVVGGRFGYKINGQYLRGEDWNLDSTDPHDLEMIERYYMIIPRVTEVSKLIVSGTAAYRFAPRTVLTATGGYATAKSPFLSDIGPLQSDGFGYRFGQIRLSAGRFFAQAYLNANEAGESFVYAGRGVASSLSGGTVIDNSTQLNLQAQYGLDFASGREEIIFGADFERTDPSTDGTINGRNEADDGIREIGVYAQSLTRLSDQVNVTLAARLDYDNIFETPQVSPRAAVVYKPAPAHSFRMTYNRAIASPGTNSLFLDITAREPDAALPFPVRARGAADGYHFERNAGYLSFAESDLVVSSLNPATFGHAQPLGLPLGPIYASIYDGLSQMPLPVLTQILCSQGLCLEEPEVAYLLGLLATDRTVVAGFSDGALGLLDLTTQRVEPISNLSDIDPLKQSTTQTFELGYRGLVGGRAHVTIDAYYSVKKNFLRGLQLETPFAMVPQLRPDLTAAIRDGVVSNAELAAALDQLGVPPETVAQLLVAFADESLPAPTLPIAIAQPLENNPGAGNSPELLMTYRNFGSVSFYGLEAAVDVAVTERTMLHGTMSYVSDDFFDHEELDEENEDLFVSLNAPTFKAGFGASHAVPGGFSARLAARYVQGFDVWSGPYTGHVDGYFLVDAGAGYDFGRYAPGMRIDVTVQNVLDHMHREFIGAPKMGRLGLARLTYSF